MAEVTGITCKTTTVASGSSVRVSSNICGVFVFRYTSQSAVVLFTNWVHMNGSQTSGVFTLQKDMDGKCNIYGVNSSLYIQNLTSNDLDVQIIGIGL